MWAKICDNCNFIFVRKEQIIYQIKDVHLCFQCVDDPKVREFYMIEPTDLKKETRKKMGLLNWQKMNGAQSGNNYQ